MFKNSNLVFISVIVAITALLQACKKEEVHLPRVPPIEEVTDYSSLNLIWYQNDLETQDEITIGLMWCFSFLGAELPSGALKTGIIWTSNTNVKIDFKNLGFSQEAQIEIMKIVRAFKESESFKEKKVIDVGRFVASIFNNSRYYYNIVGVPKTYSEFKSQYSFLPKKAGILESLVSFGEREIHLPDKIEWGKMAFVANEFHGNINAAVSNPIEETEVMDLMPNGQQRFAVYDKTGVLINGADPDITQGGKPSKCLWCHETDIPKAFVSITSAPGYYSISEFDSIISLCNEELYTYREGLNSELDFKKRQEHTILEKLYIRFMEPSAKRLAQEWDITEQEVLEKLTHLTPHEHEEFSEMGDLFYRSEVDVFNEIMVIEVPTDARETIGLEPIIYP